MDGIEESHASVPEDENIGGKGTVKCARKGCQFTQNLAMCSVSSTITLFSSPLTHLHPGL